MRRPNQTLQPTHMLVTIRAYARLAPSIRAADLGRSAKFLPMSAKCPKCGSVVNHLEIVLMSASVRGAPKYKAVTYVCPTASCRTILSAQIDPIALRADTVSQVARAVGSTDSAETEDLLQENRRLLRHLVSEVDRLKRLLRV